jgi:hypothetical protein
MKFVELDVVRLLNAHPQVNLKVGDLGTVVLVFTVPNEAYEVEFSDNEGGTIAQIALLPDELEKFE